MKRIEDYAETFSNDCYMERQEDGKIAVCAGNVAIYDNEEDACNEWERPLIEWNETEACSSEKIKQ